MAACQGRFGVQLIHRNGSRRPIHEHLLAGFVDLPQDHLTSSAITKYSSARPGKPPCQGQPPSRRFLMRGKGLGADFVLGPAVDRRSVRRDSRRGMQRPDAIEVEILGRRAAVNTLSTFLNTRKTRLKIKFDWNALRKL
jgi:hypothetical protein